MTTLIFAKEPTATPDSDPIVGGPSKVLVQLVEGASYLFRTQDKDYELEIDELLHTDGDADLASYDGMLGDAIAPMLESDFWKVGWFVIEGFTCHYSRDYWGECDVDYECTNVRPATYEDFAELGIPDQWPNP